MGNTARPKISGFTIVRNASHLDYPFPESVLSVLPLCDEFIINCGDSSDNTRELVAQLEKQYPDKIRVLETVWTRENQSGGFQLKIQSDAALKLATGDWCFYIQADEVVHEENHPQILAAIHKANTLSEVDGILFDYLHFYGNFSYQIRGRNWYRKEVRLFKNNRGIEAFRDAQGFRKKGNRLKVIPSLARVFHYAYVRTSESLVKKSVEMSQWWGKAPDTSVQSSELKRHVGLARFRNTHPAVMHERISQNDKYCNPMECARRWDKSEIKNAITLVWESVFPFRIGEFRNYEIF